MKLADVPLSLENISLEDPENTSVARPTLESLPVEIFIRIVDFLGTAREITNLSKTCRQLNIISKEHAWRRFVLSQFPTLTYGLRVSSPETLQSKLKQVRSGQGRQLYSSRTKNESGSQWEHLAKSMTSQSRAWDCRAFTVSRIAPLASPRPDIERASVLSRNIPITRYDPETQTHTTFTLDRTSRGSASSAAQTTGYHPVVDAKLEFSNCLHNKKEIVAWSTGANVFIRVRRSGSLNPSQKEFMAHKDFVNDAYNNVTNSASIMHREYREGFDDVVTLNIVPPTLGIRGEVKGPVVDTIIGRASGSLNRFSIHMCPVTDSLQHDSLGEYAKVVVNNFLPGSRQGQSAQRKITSTDVCGEEASYLACSSDRFLTLYQTESFTHDIEPLDEIEVESQSHNRTRAVKFLSREKIVVGLEGHHDALRTYKVTPGGLTLIDKLPTPLHGEASQTGSVGHQSKNSIYALEPVSTTSRPGGNLNGDMFLSGSYDGVVRLFDLRASLTPVAQYGENNDCPVYSLATYGQERFVAGTARSKLQIFDFRLGNKVYSYTEALPCKSRRSEDAQPEMTHLSLPKSMDVNGSSTQWRGHHGSRIYIPQFPMQAHSTLNLQKLGKSIESLQTPCCNGVSKIQAKNPQLQPQLCQSTIFSSFEAFYKNDLSNGLCGTQLHLSMIRRIANPRSGKTVNLMPGKSLLDDASFMRKHRLITMLTSFSTASTNDANSRDRSTSSPYLLNSIPFAYIANTVHRSHWHRI